MSEQKLVKRAKVILKGSKTYKVNGRKFIKDVPEILKGSIIDGFRTNGKFKVIDMEPKKVKKISKDSSKSKSSKDKPSKDKSSKKKDSKKKAAKKNK